MLQTLIRAYWSPAHTTAQRYLYTGDPNGTIFIYGERRALADLSAPVLAAACCSCPGRSAGACAGSDRVQQAHVSSPQQLSRCALGTRTFGAWTVSPHQSTLPAAGLTFHGSFHPYSCLCRRGVGPGRGKAAVARRHRVQPELTPLQARSQQACQYLLISTAAQTWCPARS